MTLKVRFGQVGIGTSWLTSQLFICLMKQSVFVRVTLKLALWVVELAELLVVVWLHYYNKIFKLII